jgi:ribose/xylose/arabinose/galactoside ABC-type transport system permease subunit
LILSKGSPLSNLSDTFNFIGVGDIFGVPFSIIVLVIVFIISYLVLKNTVFGRYVYAIGGNEQAAWASGINVN